MNLRIFTAAAAFGCLLLSSCYPYQENPRRPHPRNQQAAKAEAEQKRLQDQRDKLKKEQDQKRKQQQAAENTNVGTIGGGTTTGPSTGNTGSTAGTTPPPTRPRSSDYPVATKVPGRDGYVLSPYNSRVISVLDENNNLLPSGTLVQDPTFPASEKKYFRVP